MPAEAALSGRTVVVTRSTGQAGELTALLRARGATVVEVPVIEIVDPPDGEAALAAALADPQGFDWIVVTSPNGARRLAACWERGGTGRARRARVAAVGRATAAALGDRHVDLVASRQIAEGLLAELPVARARALLVQADRARRVLADGLRTRGWEVVEVVAYHTVASHPPPERVRLVARADAVTFASASAVRSFVDAFGTAAVPAVVSIGPQTSAAAAELGLRVAAEAATHDLPGLVAATVAAIGAGQRSR